MYIFTTSELLLFYLQIKYSMTTNLLERLVFIYGIAAFSSGVVWGCVCFLRRRLVRYRLCTASLHADVGVRRLDGEWRGQSLVMLADGPCMNICVIKKKCQRQTADCGEIWQLPKSIMPLTHLSGAAGPGGWKIKKRRGEKRKTQRARWKSRALHLGSVSFGFSTAITVGSVLVRPCEKSKYVIVSLLSVTKVQLLPRQIKWKIMLKLKTSTLALFGW